MTHPFDAALAFDLTSGHVRGRTSPDYANMVGPFGGLTAAAIVRAISVHPDRLGEPVSLTVNYAAPIADGEFDIDLRAVRTNRTNQHWIAELSQAGEVKTTATAVFGVRRATWADTEARPPAAPAPEECARQDISGFVVWTGNYEMRFVEGAMPAEEAARARSRRPPCGCATSPARTRPSGADGTVRRVLPAGVPAARTVHPGGHHLVHGVLPRRRRRPGPPGRRLSARHRTRPTVLGRLLRPECAAVGPRGTLLATSHQLVYFKS